MTENSQQNTDQRSLSQDFAIGLATGFNSSVINAIFKSGLPGTSALMLGDVSFNVAMNNITGSELGKAFIQVGVGFLTPGGIFGGAAASIAVGELYDKTGDFIQSSFEKYYLDKKYGTIEQIRAEFQRPAVVFKGDNGGLFKIENGKYVEVDSSSIPNNNTQDVLISKSSSSIKNNDLEIKITDNNTSIASSSLNQNELVNSSKTLLNSQKAGSTVKIESTDGTINASLLNESLRDITEKFLADETTLQSKTITIPKTDIGKEGSNLYLVKSDEGLTLKDGSTATLSSLVEMTQTATEVTEKFVNGYMSEAKSLFTTGDGIASLISDVSAGLEKGLEPEQIAKIIATKLVVKTAMSQIKNEFILSESDQALLDQGKSISDLSSQGQEALANFAVNHPAYNTAYLAAVSFATTILLNANDGMNGEEYTAAAIEATAQAAAQTAISTAISKGWLNMSSSAGAGLGAAAGYVISASIRDMFADDHMNSHQWQSTFASAGVLGVAAYAGAAAGSAIATAMSLGAFAGPIGIVGAVIATIVVSQFMGGKEYGPGEYADPSQIIQELYHISSKADGSGLEIFGVGKEGVTLKASANGVDNIYGSRQSDVLVGNDQKNIIVGSSGNDNGTDNDMIEGKGGDDILLGKEGHDHIDGGDGNDQIDGGTGNDRLIGGNGNDVIIGDQGDDTIDGGNGDDQIDAGDGDDIIYTGSGNDVVVSGAGDDQIETGEGDDVIFSENGNDLIKSGAGDDQIDSGDGNDEVYGGDGNDSINAGLGDDIIFAGNGVDIINAGLGNDIVDAGKNDDLVLGGTGNDIVYGNDGNDELYGELGNDYLMGGIGDDKIVGSEGDDILDGNKGNDDLDGGTGNDLYIHTIGDGITKISDEAGLDTLRIFGIADDRNLSFVQNGNNLEIILAGTSNDKITIKDQFSSDTAKVEILKIDNGIKIDLSSLNFSSGSPAYNKSSYDDRIDSSTLTEKYQNILKDSDQEVVYNGSSSWYQDNYDVNVINEVIDYTKYNEVEIRSYKAKRNIFGGYYNVYYKYYEHNLGGTLGNDKIVGSWWSENIWGGDGDDYLYGNDGNDNIFGGNDNDLIYLGDGNDNGYGENGTDKIYGGEGSDNVEGNNGNDTLYGEGGNDVIMGRIGDDLMLGGKGNDFIKGGEGNDIAFGGDNSDNIDGNDGNDYLLGENGDDIISGGSGDDTIIGGNGNDIVYGNDGNDLIKGGNGLDIIDGGDGNDQINAGAGNDMIFDGKGSDQITLGDGKDIFITQTTNGGTKTINDFDKNEDRIVLKDITTGFSSLIANHNLIQDGSDVRFSYGSSYNLILKDTLISELNPNNFITSIVGNELDNILSGDDYANAIFGLDGNDILNGNGGDDLLWGGNGSDQLNGNAGDDILYYNIDSYWQGSRTLVGKWDIIERNPSTINANSEDSANLSDHSASQDLFNGGDGEDVLIMSEQSDTILLDLAVEKVNDWNSSHYEQTAQNGYNGFPISIETIYAFGGDDIINLSSNINTYGDVKIYGDSGNDTIWTNQGNDILFGGDGNDNIQAGAGNDLVYGESDDDNINGGLGDDILHGGSGNDTIQGWIGNDTLYGDEGNDTLYGFGENDIISGGKGDDYLDGHTGNDTYIFNVGDGNDTIFDGGSADPLDIIKFGEGITKDDLILRRQGSDLKIIFKNNGADSIVVKNHYYYDDYKANEQHNQIEKLAFSNGEEITIINSAVFTYTEGSDTIYGSHHSNDIIYGLGGNDTINSNAGDDTVYGGDGNDNIDGWSGNDTIYGDAGNDYIMANEGDDLVYGGSGIDTIKGWMGNDTIHGDSGDDNIDGWSGNDVIYGDAGNDYIMANEGDDIVYGGDGNDEIEAWSGNDTIYGDAGDDYIMANEGNDIVYGGDGNDNIRGWYGFDIVSGGKGNDYLDGGTGNDSYIFNYGDGNDTIYDANFSQVGNAGASDNKDSITFGAGISKDDLMFRKEGSHLRIVFRNNPNDSIFINYQFENNHRIELLKFDNGDVLDFSKAITLIGTDNGETINTGATNDTIYAQGGNDSINSGQGDDTVYGGDGNDNIDGWSGNDTIYGDAGNDYIMANEGDDLVYGGSGIDTIKGWMGNDTIHGDSGDDNIDGWSGNDTIYGDAGNDYIMANEGDDIVYGGDGNDEIQGWMGNDIIYGGGDNDNIDGWSGNDTIYGDAGNDYIMANEGNDTIYGGDGNDQIKGWYGNDKINGGKGADLLIGGSGYDSFDFSSLQDSSRSSIDTISDFEQGIDKINLSQIVEDLSFNSFEFTVGNGHTIIKDHNSDFAIDLVGHFNLHQSDFVF